jgi:group II intron reverse transcriptase/maturase
MARDLTQIREKARKEPKTCFTSIYHYVTDEDNLHASYWDLEPGKAPGIDGVTKEEYGEDLEEKVTDLAQRLARLEYRPKPVRRVYIPKPGSDKKRPLGIPCFEDKLVEKAMARVLEQIYEVDFLDCSHGYRPGRTCHQALDELGRTIQRKKVSFVVEADIRGFFDHVNHEWLLKFLGVRIGDNRVLRLIWRMLKGGVMEDGLTHASEEGTPQGGNLSPLLSNVYLHYALDLWFERRFRKQCRGEAYIFRFADDFLACFQFRDDAEQFLTALTERLGKFHLELEPTKTKLLNFGRFAREAAEREGKKPETFDFLGFTHYCGLTRNGSFKVKRRTSKKKFRAKLKEMQAWLKQSRSRLKAGELLRQAKVKLQGHLNYYAITDNQPMCESYSRQVKRLLFTWLNRRSQRRSYNWERFNDALAWVGWPLVRIVRKLDPFRKIVGSENC